MKTLKPTAWLVSLICVAAFTRAADKPAAFDVVAPDKRKAALEMANQLASVHDLVPLPKPLINPFDPSGFGQADADERAAELAAARAARQTAPARLPNDRELLETIASKIVPTGTTFLGNEPILYLFKKPVKIGTRFTVTYSGVDYILELIAIDRTTFTLRYNREEIIRPISKPGK